MSVEAKTQAQLEKVSHYLRYLVELRAALAPFRATLQVLGDKVCEPEARRQLLSLWRPCQERLDWLLDTAPRISSRMAHLRLLRQEMEGSLLDEMYNLAALNDLADAFDQACEVMLLKVEGGIRSAVAKLGEMETGSRGDHDEPDI
jgi:hypothetical protein